MEKDPDVFIYTCEVCGEEFESEEEILMEEDQVCDDCEEDENFDAEIDREREEDDNDDDDDEDDE